MPKPAVRDDEKHLLKCGCMKEEALLEEIYVRLGFAGSEIASQHPGENGWKVLSRPERWRIMQLLERLGVGMDDLLLLIQD